MEERAYWISVHRRAWLLLLLALPMTLQGQFLSTATNGSVTITGYTGSISTVVIPATIGGLPVTQIGATAFRRNQIVNSLIVTNAVTNIASHAFAICLNLTNITIGSKVTSLDFGAFYSCFNLSQISVDPSNTAFSSQDRVLFDRDQTTLIWCPPGMAGNYVIPNTVTNVAPDAFKFRTNLASVSIPNTIGGINSAMFAGCTSLTNVTIAPGITNIGSMAFLSCASLNGVVIPGSVNSIGANAFGFCPGMTNLVLGDGLATISDAAFWGCAGLPGVSFPNSVTGISNTAFFECTGLTNIAIGSSTTWIGTNVFSWCLNLTDITVDVSNPAYCSIDGILFSRDKTKLLQYPQGRFTDYAVPSGVTSIGDSAFFDSNIRSITFPTTLTNIGASAFEDCEFLTGLYFAGNAPATNPPGIIDVTNVPVYYLAGTFGWSKTFAGLLTTFWLPRMQTNDGSMGFQTNQFGFNIDWASGLTVQVETSTNLSTGTWSPLKTFKLTNGSAYFSDSSWTNYPGRFYRIHSH